MPPTVRKADPLLKFRYRVVFEGYPQIGFSKVAGLEEETGVVEYREGDDPPTPRKQTGLTKYTNLVFSRGLDSNGVIQQIRDKIVQSDGPNFGDGEPDGYRFNGFIYIWDKSHKPTKTFKFFDALAIMKSIDDLDAMAEDIVLENLTLAIEGLKLITR